MILVVPATTKDSAHMAKQGIALREWTISASDYATEDDFRQAVAGELAGFEHIGERLGIGLVALPARQRLPDGAWVTVGWVFKTTTVPAVRDNASEVEALEQALGEAALVEDGVPEPTEA